MNRKEEMKLPCRGRPGPLTCGTAGLGGLAVPGLGGWTAGAGFGAPRCCQGTNSRLVFAHGVPQGFQTS